MIGAGPVGLAAAAHLAKSGEKFIVLEAGTASETIYLSGGMFDCFLHGNTMWTKRQESCLKNMVGMHLPLDELPTGNELVEDYLEKLANLPEIKPYIF